MPDQKFLFFEVQGLDKETFQVVSLSGTEGVSSLFQFDLDVISGEQDLDFQKVLGKPGHLRIRGVGGERHVHGIVRRIEETSRSQEYSRFSVNLVPAIWKLALRQTSRIFQDKSIPDVVQKVLKDAGIPSGEVKVTVHGDHTPWIYCVQYRESDLAFVCRLLEQEGIFFFFQHDDSKAVLRLGDDPSDHPPCPGVGKLPVRVASGMAGSEETVTSFGVSEEVRPDATAVRDYNFEIPHVDQTGTAKEGPGLGTEIYDAPGDYEEAKDSREIAKLRLQEVRATRRLCSGETTCNRMIPGHLFEVDKHARRDLNRKYLLLQVSHHGSQPQVLKEEGFGMSSSYTCTFQCIPSDVPYRPPRVTPRPLAQGAQTAVVTGPPGSEIHTDKHGRVKVRFFWDRDAKGDDTTSCWIRVSMPWAGVGWGGVQIPRVGTEVVVEFLEGDPDRPLITGRVYNAATMPPLSNAGRKPEAGPAPTSMEQAAMMMTLRSNSLGGSGGHNEITMNDAGGAEGLFLKAQKDEVHTVGNDREDSVTNNETRSVGVDRTRSVGANESVKIGADRTKSVGANETIEVGANRTATIKGNESLTVAMTKNEAVGAASTESVGGAKALTVGAAYAVTVGGVMNTGVGLAQFEEVGLTKKVVVGNSVEISCGSSKFIMDKSGKITIEGSEIAIKASGNVTINGAKIDLN